ncbi:response regulator [Flavobacterium sp.]|uniref:response regulator n=1 Tax=Flavobacterium sp. TaxID=239 RepID=UPI00375368B4
MKKYNTVFIIDDDIVFHFIIKKLFLKTDLQVNTNYFFNGLEAIEVLRNQEIVPDLILLDINMPIYDGWQFLEEFRNLKASLNKNIDVFLISSSNDISDINKAAYYKDEVKRYCNKPLTIQELQDIFD